MMHPPSSTTKGTYTLASATMVSWLMLVVVASSEDITILKNSTHTGTLKALDFNLFQTNLLASAGSNSEVRRRDHVHTRRKNE